MTPFSMNEGDWLRCPQCVGKLEERDQGLVCLSCTLAYPIIDGIPIMLKDRARTNIDDKQFTTKGDRR